MELITYEDVVYAKVDNLDPASLLKYAKEFEYRSDDIIMCTYAKCGTHWLRNMICKLKSIDYFNPSLDTALEFGPPEALESLDSPRVVSTHLKPSRLPTEHIQKKGKIVLMLRNPKDVFVSWYYHIKNAVLLNGKQTWDEHFQSQMDGLVLTGSYFDYVQQWEEFLKENPDLPVEIFYFEDFKADLNGNLARLSKFLGFNRDQEYLDKVKEATTLSAQREQAAPEKKEVHPLVKDKNGETVIYRKGEVGDWKNYFTVAQSELVDKVMEQRLKHGIIKIKYQI